MSTCRYVCTTIFFIVFVTQNLEKVLCIKCKTVWKPTHYRIH